MDDLKKSVQDIEKNLDNIAYAIASVVKKGSNKDEFEDFYNGFYEKLKSSKYFFLKNKLYRDRYDGEVNNLINKVSDIIGYNLKSHIFSGKHISIIATPKNVVKETPPKFLSDMYKGNKEKYNSMMIDFSVLHKTYLNGGIDKVEELNELLNLIDKKLSFYKLKSFVSAFKELFEISHITSMMDRMFEKYKIKTFKDLLRFNVEIDSFFVNKEDLNDTQKVIVDQNINNFKNRINAKSDFALSEKEARRLKKRIERFVNSNMYRQIIQNTNINDFFEMNDIKLSDLKLKDVVSHYMHLLEVKAFVTGINIDGKESNVCFLQPYILKENSRIQDITILHESVHFLQSRKYRANAALSFYCVPMTEAITQYLAIEAKKHLKDNILSINGDVNKENDFVYDCMIPLVQKLAEYDIWDVFVKAYFNNSTYFLINKIGNSNVNKIKECFDVVYLNREANNIDEIVEICLKKLTKVMEDMKRIKR